MFRYGVLALAMATMISTATLEAGDCGCTTSQVQSCGCASQCNSCCNPVKDFLTGVHYNLKVGLSNVKNSFSRVFHPVCYRPACASSCATSCGCETSTYQDLQYGSPKIEVIEEETRYEKTSIPNPPVPPTDESNIVVPEPARFQPPGKWKSAQTPRQPALYYSRVMASRASAQNGSTSRPAGYYAPTHRVSDQ